MADTSSRVAKRPVPIVADGEPVYFVRSGAAYRGVHARDVGNGLFVIREPVRDIQISDIGVEGGYRVIENSAVSRQAGAGCAGLHVRGARASNLERGFARIRYDSHDGVIADVIASGMLTTGATDLPVGIAFDGTAHGFRLERCVDPIKIGGIGDTTHFAIMAAPAGEPLVITIDHLIVKSDRGWPIFDVHKGAAKIIVRSHDIQVPPGTPLVRSRGGGSVPGGVSFAGTPPKL